MSKRLKAALLVCMLFCLTLFGAVLAACTPSENPGDGGDPITEPETATYNVTVTDAAGNKLPGIQVQLCTLDGTCYLPVTTNANGVATLTGPAATYHIQIYKTQWDSIVAEYPEATYEDITTTEGVYDYTLVVNYGEGRWLSYTYTIVDEDGNPVQGAILSVTLMAYDETGESGDYVPYYATSNANGIATLILTGETQESVDGYEVHITPPAGYQYSGDEIGTNDENRRIVLEKARTGGNYGDFSMVNAIVTDELGLSTTVSIPMYTLGATDTYDVLFDEEDTTEYFYTFQTTTAGRYRVTLDLPEGIDLAVKEYSPYEASMGAFYLAQRGPVDDAGNMITDATVLEFEISEEHAADLRSSTHTFGISLTSEDVTLPVELQFTLERIGDPTPAPEQNEIIVPVTNLPEVYEAPEGLLTGVALDGSAEPVLDSDGYYHIGTVDGPYLLAKLNGASRYMDASFSTAEMSGNKNLHIPGSVNPETNTYPVYAYVSYVDPNADILEVDPNSFIAQYSSACNGDGVVRVTEELRLFLKRYAGYMGAMGIYQGEVSEENYWLIPCYYYQSDATEVAYRSEASQPAVLNGNGFYEVTIPANGTAYLRAYGYRGYEITVYSASASAMFNNKQYQANDGTEFSFQTEPQEHDEYYSNWWTNFSLSNSGTSEITVRFSVANGTFGTTARNPYTLVEDVVMGVAYDSVSLYYAFKPSESGLYAFRAYGEGMNPMITVSGEENPFGSGEDGFLATQQLTAGTTYIYELGSQLSAGATYSIVVTKVDAIEGEGTQEDPYVISGEGEYALTYPLDPSSTDASVVYMDTIYVTIDGDSFWTLTAEDFGFTYPNIHYNDPSSGKMQMGLSYGFSSVSGVDEYWLEDAIIVTVEEQEPGTSEHNPIELEINTPTTVTADSWYTVTFEDDGFYTLYTTDPDAYAEVNGQYVAASTRGFTYNMGGSETDWSTLETTYLPVEAGEAYIVHFGTDFGATTYTVWLVEGSRPDYDQPDSGSGTEADPYVISKALTYRAVVPAGGSVYYSISGSDRFTVTVEDVATAQVVYNGETYTPVDGVITFVTDEEVPEIVFTTSDGAALAYNFSLTEYVVYEPIAAEGKLVGTMLVPGENTVTEGADFFTPANYYFVPAQSGDYKVSVSGAQFAFDYYNAQFGGNDQYFMYDGDSTVIYMKAGTVYAFYSYTAGTVTFTPVDVAYDSYIGEGREDSRFILGGAGSGIGAYEVEIGSNTTLYFSYGATTELRVSASSTAVSATYNGTVYAADGETPFSFTSAAPLGIGSVTFSVTNNTNETVTIVLYVSQTYTLTAPGEGGEPTGTEVVEGTNTCTVYAADYADDGSSYGTSFYFTAETAGIYSFNLTTTAAGELALVDMNSAYPESIMEFPYSVELEAGETFEFCINIFDWNAWAAADGTVTVTITQP